MENANIFVFFMKNTKQCFNKRRFIGTELKIKTFTSRILRIIISHDCSLVGAIIQYYFG